MMTSTHLEASDDVTMMLAFGMVIRTYTYYTNSEGNKMIGLLTMQSANMDLIVRPHGL